MRIEDTKKEPEIAEMIEGSEGDRRRLSELLDGIRVGPGVDAMADGMREAVWADVRSRIRRRGIRMRKEYDSNVNNASFAENCANKKR